MIFVFGSNLAGIHGGGAAKYAHQQLGAVWGVGSGPSGQTYALPTKNEHIETRSFSEIAASVGAFKRYAAKHPEDTFQVTRIGCGLAGFADSQIAPLFADAPKIVNLILFGSLGFRVANSGERSRRKNVALHGNK
jgi:hypothetical protein